MQALLLLSLNENVRFPPWHSLLFFNVIITDIFSDDDKISGL